MVDLVQEWAGSNSPVAWHDHKPGSDAVAAIGFLFQVFALLANLPLSNPFTRHFVQFLHWLVPKPDLAYVLDADAEAARARKPEYPVEFMRECRAAYLHLAALLGSMTVIGPLPLSETTKEVETVAMQALGIQQPSSSCLDTATV